MQTSHIEADDWLNLNYTTRKLEPRKNSIASKESKSKTMAIAVSAEQNVVALASLDGRKGSLELRQYCYHPLPLVLHSATVDCACSLVQPLTLSFADGGRRIILITGDVLPSETVSLTTGISRDA